MKLELHNKDGRILDVYHTPDEALACLKPDSPDLTLDMVRALAEGCPGGVLMFADGYSLVLHREPNQ